MLEQTERLADPRPEPDASVRFRLTAEDLLGDLLWPKLFRVPALAFRPGRIGLSVVALLLVALVDKLLAWMAGSEPLVETIVSGVSMRLGGVPGDSVLDAGGVLMGAFAALTGACGELWQDAPVRLLILLPVALLVHGLVAVAVGRMTAEEFAIGRFPTWTEGLAWAVRSVPAVLLAHLVPVLVVALLLGVVSVAAWGLLSVPFVNVVGAVLGVVALGIALVCAVLTVGYALGFGMLSPAIACEGSDGIDAMQRVYAGVLGRPGRWAVYSLILAVQFVIVSSIAFALASLTVGLGVWSMSLWLGEHATLVASGIASDEPGAGGRAAASVMATVLSLPGILATGYLYAYWISGWTVQHLLLRRALDGQDVTDIYIPGVVQARVDEVMSRRANEDPAA